MNEKPTHVRVLFGVFVTYLVLAGAYALYGAITETGLFGWIMDIQFRMFHEAELKITAILTFLILLIPVIPLGSYLRRKGYKMGARGRQQMVVDNRHDVLVYAPVEEKPPSLMWAILIGIAPFVISLIIYGYVTIVDANNQNRQVYKMDLSKSADLPAADAKFVELSSTCQQDLKYEVIDKSGINTRQAYTPLTGPMWTSGEPIKYFLYFSSEGDHATIPGSFNIDTGRYDVPPPKGPYKTTFSGQLSTNALPTYVRNAYERQGLKVADTTYLLTWMGQFNNNRVESQYSSQMYYLIPVVGAFVSALVLFVLVLSYFTRKKRFLQSVDGNR